MSTKLINYVEKNCNWEICYNRIRNRRKCFWSEKCPSGMCLVGEMSVGEVSVGEMSVGDVSGRGNVRRGSVRRGCVRRGSVRTPFGDASKFSTELEN